MTAATLFFIFSPLSIGPTLGVKTLEFFSHVKKMSDRLVQWQKVEYPRKLAMFLAIEWEHEVRVLLRSNRSRSSPASFEDWGFVHALRIRCCKQTCRRR